LPLRRLRRLAPSGHACAQAPLRGFLAPARRHFYPVICHSPPEMLSCHLTYPKTEFWKLNGSVISQHPEINLSYSMTLRRYYKLLWSKVLPSGEVFDLNDTTPGHDLHHRSGRGTFSLSSDAVTPHVAVVASNALQRW
jgi:hypothetical protein